MLDTYYYGVILKILAVVLPAMYITYRLLSRNHKYFVKKKVKFDQPTLVLGNLGKVVMRKVNVAENIRSIYNRYRGEKIVGFFNFMSPVYLVNDPQMVKKLFAEDSDYFINHGFGLDASMDPLLGNQLIVMKDQKWKDMRNTLTPAFTASKMKIMLQLINGSAAQLVEFVEKKQAVSTLKCQAVEMDLKDVFSKTIVSIIGTCAFGIEVNALQNPQNEFSKAGKALADQDLMKMIKFILISICPGLMSKLQVHILDGKTAKFFRNLIQGTMQERERLSTVRPDMIHLLMQAKKGTLDIEAVDCTDTLLGESPSARPSNSRKWTDDEITAQCITFFGAGYETVTTLCGFAAYELAINPSIQVKAIQEVDTVCQSLRGQPLDYDSLQKLKYLEMILLETLRKWPPFAATDRQCVKNYVLKSDDDYELNIEKGRSLWVPVFAFHYDERYFSNPAKFDPDRFSDENRKKIVPYTYLPFGAGPRNCIGNRFALMQAKAVFYHLLLKFKFDVGPNTQVPIVLSKKSFQMEPEKGFNLMVKQRVKNT